MPTPVPTVAQVSPHIRRRVEDGASVEQSASIDAFAAEAATEVDAEVGAVPASLEGMARVAATYLAAYKFERSEYPEQQDGGTAQMLRDDYTDALARLQRAVADAGRENARRVTGTIEIDHALHGYPVR